MFTLSRNLIMMLENLFIWGQLHIIGYIFIHLLVHLPLKCKGGIFFNEFEPVSLDIILVNFWCYIVCVGRPNRLCFISVANLSEDSCILFIDCLGIKIKLKKNMADICLSRKTNKFQFYFNYQLISVIWLYWLHVVTLEFIFILFRIISFWFQSLIDIPGLIVFFFSFYPPIITPGFSKDWYHLRYSEHFRRIYMNS